MNKWYKLYPFIQAILFVFSSNSMENPRSEEIGSEVPLEVSHSLSQAIKNQNYDLIRNIVSLFPLAAAVRDPLTGLYPFERILTDQSDIDTVRLLAEPLEQRKKLGRRSPFIDALIKSIRLRRPDLVSLFLDHGAPIDRTTMINSEPALAVAARQVAIALSESEEMSRINDIFTMLLEHAQQINLKKPKPRFQNERYKDGQGLLHIIAAGQDNPDLVSLLLGLKFEPDAQDDRGNTPLHIAIAHNNQNSANVLLAEEQTNVNSRNNRGITPLMIAAINGNADLVENLLNRGASRAITDNNGLNFLDHATPEIRIRFTPRIRIPRLILPSQFFAQTPDFT